MGNQEVGSREQTQSPRTASSASFFVKVRKAGARRWSFFTGQGLNHLRIHAVEFSDRARAQATVDNNAPLNPGFEWKVVEAA